MSVTRDKNTGKWMSQIRVKDWTGKEIHKKKRGFKTKKEALQWEQDFISQADGSLGMKFKDFVEIYMKDVNPRLRETTLSNSTICLIRKSSHTSARCLSTLSSQPIFATGRMS